MRWRPGIGAGSGGIDEQVLVHNAGVTRDKTLDRMKEEAWDLTLEVNLAGVLRVTEAMVDGPLNDGARIICLASIAGIGGLKAQAIRAIVVRPSTSSGD
jgi:3-oxoacyl-[acyl-carrier protein] reductase